MRAASVFVFLMLLLVGANGNAMKMFEELSKILPATEIENEYNNLMAEQYIYEEYGSSKLKMESRCNTVNMACFSPAKKIKAGDLIVSVDPNWSLDVKKVLDSYPTWRQILMRPEIEEILSPTLIHTLFLWGDLHNSESLIMTFLQVASTMSFGNCGSVLKVPICTPHLWDNHSRHLIYPSRIHDLIEEELAYLRKTYKLLQQYVFPVIPDLKESIYHSEQVWIELFLTVRAYTFIRPYDQEQVFFFPMTTFPHNPESKVKVVWNENVFALFADKDYLHGEISVNYWELLGSLSAFLGEGEDVSVQGVNPEEYELQKNATLNSEKILLHMGQLPPTNEQYTNMILQIVLHFDDSVVERFLQNWVDKLEFVNAGVAEFRLQPNVFPAAFMSVARLVSLQMEDLSSDIQKIVANGTMVNLNNEFRAMKKVYRLLQQYIDSYNQPREYIEEILRVHHTKLSRGTYYRLRLHYFELNTLQSAQEALLTYWSQLLHDPSND